MKFVPVFLLFGCRCGRPSSRGVLFSTDTIDLQSSNDDLKSKCASVNQRIDEDWTRECLKKDECCSKTIVKSLATTWKDERKYVFVCGCISAGKKAIGGAPNCCSGRLDQKDKGKCGCILPDEGNTHHLGQTLIPLVRTDCCYLTASFPQDDNTRVPSMYNSAVAEKCGPRICISKDEQPHIKETPCCGNSSARTVKGWFYGDYKLCNCLASGTRTRSKKETVVAEDCCSGHFRRGTTDCDCIQGGDILPPGAEKTSCCNKNAVPRTGKDKIERKFCETDECKSPHQLLLKGNRCCIEKDPKKYKAYKDHTTTAKKDTFRCPCLKGGTTLIKDEHADWCCSGKADKGKCLFIDYDTPINHDYMTEEECFSGREANGKCLCMKPGDTRRGTLPFEEGRQCCSGGIHNGACSCVHGGSVFRKGGTTPDCCSKDSKASTCLCGGIGTTFQKKLGMKSNPDCCTKVEAGGFCACRGKDAAAATGKDDQCCGDSKDGKCSCLADGTAVSPFFVSTPELVCCSKSSTHEVDDRGCKIKVCGKKPAK